MKKRSVTIFLLFCLMLVFFSACKGPADDSFTVDYAGQVSIFNPTLFIAGKYKGETMKVDVRSFKDFADFDYSTLEYIDGENAVFSGTEDGLTKIEGGIRLTMADTSGKKHVVEIKNGSRFKVAEKTADGVLLVFPD